MEALLLCVPLPPTSVLPPRRGHGSGLVPPETHVTQTLQRETRFCLQSVARPAGLAAGDRGPDARPGGLQEASAVSQPLPPRRPSPLPARDQWAIFLGLSGEEIVT